MNQSLKKLIFFFAIAIFTSISHDVFCQIQQDQQKTRSITPQQYHKWVNMTVENFMVTVNNTIDVTESQRNAIRKDAVRVKDSSTRPDLSRVDGLIIAKEAFKMISQNLTQVQVDKLEYFNPLKR